MTASDDNTARISDVTWATLEFGDALRERVCAEKLIGAAQEFSDGEIDEDPILRGMDKNDPVARNPCLRRGPLSLDYWRTLAFRATAYRRAVNSPVGNEPVGRLNHLAHRCPRPMRRHDAIWMGS